MLEFTVPNHDKDLNEIESTIETIKNEMAGRVKTMSIVVRDNLKKTVITQMYRLGFLSTPIFELRIPMEDAYFKKYGRKGKKMFLNHYEFLHERYDFLKEEIYTLFKKLN